MKTENISYRVTKKQVIASNAASHAGKKAVCVRLEDGFIAWGFCDTFESAEQAALSKAKKLSEISNGII